MRPIKFEYGFESVNGIVKKAYELHEIPNIKEKCDVWGVLPIKYVRQFTGLTDKNGREIYEGDILKFTYEDEDFITSPVYWELKICSWVMGLSLGYIVPEDLFLQSDFKDAYEIIGNIYENPELLTP